MNKTTRPLVPESPMPAPAVIDDAFIKSRILTIRGVQVMLDRDLAMLYGVDAKRINEQVKRNAERFPDDFMFRLTKEECLRSQIATLNVERGKHLKYMPYAFTESGVAMLSGVLRSAIAVNVNIRIMRAFVAMRRAFVSMAPMVARLDSVEQRQITDQARNEERFDTIFKAMDGGDFPPQKVFYEGRHYDAYSFARKLVRKATMSIILVDSYADDVTLDILSQKRGGASVTLATTQKMIDKFLSATAIAKFNKQNPPLKIRAVGIFHDRFLILDGTRTSAANTAPSREWTHCSFRPFSKGSKRDDFSSARQLVVPSSSLQTTLLVDSVVMSSGRFAEERTNREPVPDTIDKRFARQSGIVTISASR